MSRNTELFNDKIDLYNKTNKVMSNRTEIDKMASARIDEIKKRKKIKWLNFRSDLFNTYSHKTGSIEDNLIGKLTFVCDFSNNLNSNKITNMIEKAALSIMRKQLC